MDENIRILGRQIISRGFGLLEKVSIDRRRFDKGRQTYSRELYDTGDGAAILLYDPSRSTVILVRQFRLPAFLADNRESLIEVCAGKLEGDDPDVCIVKEVAEETGFTIKNPQRLFEAYSSPGSFAEKLTFFAAPYRAQDRTGKGGGLDHEAEDIEVLELTLDDALAMIETGEIVDAKTILLLQYAKMKGLMKGE